MNSASALGHELRSSLRPQATPTMFVVDDVSVCESLELLIHCEGWRPETSGRSARRGKSEQEEQ